MNRLALCALAMLLPGAAFATTVFIEPTRDNTLYESPSGRLSNALGEHMFTGLSQDLIARRAVIAFSDLRAIPEGATISSVKLHLHLSEENSDATRVDVHRLAADWGQGTSKPVAQEILGTNATPDDPTWVHRFYDRIPWSTPGGDFEAAASASMEVDSVGHYVFGNSQGLVDDVQRWVDNPGSNFGWILLAGENRLTTRRWDTRDHSDPAVRPLLEVTFTTTGSFYDFSGPWFDPALDGEGYLVFQTTAGWIIYFFGYSSGEDRLWLVSQAVKLDALLPGVPFELPMLVGEPGSFETPTPSSELEPWGTLTVTFFDCGNGEFILDGLDGMKTSRVIKIIGVDGTDCEDP